MKPYELLPPAEQELDDSASFYNEDSAGVGDRLIDNFLSVMKRLGDYPESGSRLSKNLRIARMRDFPYSIVYRVKKDRILVVAVAHQSRRLGYWKGRI